MTKYRGVEKEDIIASMKAGEEFMRSLNMGPLSAKILDIWAGQDPYAILEFAEDNQALVRAMHVIDAADVFRTFHEVIKQHAAFDADDTAKTVYADLCKWGAFSKDYPAGTSEWPNGNENEVHLLLAHLKLIVAQGPELPAETAKMLAEKATIFGASTEPGKNEISFGHEDGSSTSLEDAAAQSQQFIYDLLQKVREGDLAGAADEFGLCDSMNRLNVTMALYEASGAHEKEKVAAKPPSPFSSYGVVTQHNMGEVLSNTETAGDALREFERLRATINETLADLIASDDVIVPDGSGTGWSQAARSEAIIFRSTTPEAAKAVAAALPDYKVYGPKGQILAAPRQAEPTPPEAPPAQDAPVSTVKRGRFSL